MPITNRRREPAGGNDRYDVLDYDINFNVPINPKSGQPAGKPEIETFVITISRDSEKDNAFFAKWLNDNTTPQSADIVFYDQTRRIRAMSISNAYLIDYRQSSPTPGQIIETLELSPMEVKLDGVTFKRRAQSS